MLAQRYQKILRSGASALAPVLVGLLAGCGSAAAPAQSAPASAQAQGIASDVVLAPLERDLRGVVVPPEARAAVLKAYDAWQKKNRAVLGAQILPASADGVLGEYPAYWWLQQQLRDRTRPIPEDDLAAFFRLSTNDYLNRRLRGDWMVAAARAGDYARVLELAPESLGTSPMDCALVLAQHMSGLAAGASQALEVFRPGETCWSMLDELYEKGVLAFADLVPRQRALLEQGQNAQARRMAAIMFDGAQMVHYAALMKNPGAWLARQGKPKGQAQVELQTIAFSRLARDKNQAARAAYVEKQGATRLPPENLQWVWSQFGLVAALNVEPEAAGWYRRSGHFPLTDYNHAWQVRAELRGVPIDWVQVRRAIERMSTRQAHEPVWVYWYARALAALGQPDEAAGKYAAIASELGFYGQLANEELGHAAFIPDFPEAVTPAELEQVRARAGLQRAIALFDLGWRPEAVREWHHALKGMDDRLLLASAELAREEHLYDRVVNTSLQTRDNIDFRQRFIAPFEGRVTEKAREVELDPAWVYGLIRQESRFITDARSRVGASGLMQLMPATAKWVAGKIGMTHFKPAMVNDFDTNTILGTRYLRMVLDGQGNSELLASAGYNAGPGRASRWRARLQAPVEGAVFAETIPFTETRLYVKNVMSNAVYYGMMFSGQPQSLKQRLGVIAPPQVAMGSKP